MDNTQYSCIEELCEKRGFEFHITGRGRWAAMCWWGMDGVEYRPWTGMVKIEVRNDQYKGYPESPEHLIEILRAMRVDYDKLQDAARSAENEKASAKRKTVMADKIEPIIAGSLGCSSEDASKIVEECGWFNKYIPLSKLSNCLVEGWAEEIIDEYENK